MNKILCLDLGTKTGWAIRINGEVISGVNDLKGSRYEGGGMRFIRFSNWLDEMYVKTRFSELRFEEVRRHLGTDAAHLYGGFLAHLSAWCEINKIPYSSIPVGTIKKFVTGRGNSNKQLMIDSIRKKGFNPVDDNEADAIGLLLTVGGEYGDKTDF